MRPTRFIAVSLLSISLVACSSGGGGGSGGGNTVQLPPPDTGDPTVTVDAGIKELVFSWSAVANATHYKLLQNPDGNSGFTQVGADIPAGTLSVRLPIAVHFHNFARALYVVQACDANGCSSSSEVNAMDNMLPTIGYFKASNTGEGDEFGTSIAISADGMTLAVGAVSERSNATGINGDQNDDSRSFRGAVYVFRFDGDNWSQQAYIKASNTEFSGWFGDAVSLSADGNTLAVGASLEESNAKGVNGDENNDLAAGSGAAYVFRYVGGDWTQQAYIKASNTDAGDRFGVSVSLSGDGNTLAVGADSENSNAAGIDGDQSNNQAESSGAAYVFRFDGAKWSQQAYIKASNAEGDEQTPGFADRFGGTLALSQGGNTLAVGAAGEDSNATGINGDQSNNEAESAGAVYVFRFGGAEWSQQAYIKASNTEGDEQHPDWADRFGGTLALSEDGDTLVVGAAGEDSNATDINGDQSNNEAESSGAAYVFRFDGTEWSQQSYIKATNAESNDEFGSSVSISTDGSTLAIGARAESSNATGVNGNEYDNSELFGGAAYVLGFDGAAWYHRAYVKASNTGAGGFSCGANDFGYALALSADGSSLAVADRWECSNATGINGNQNDDSFTRAGAAYLY